MTHRIDIQRGSRGRVVEVQGLIDAAAVQGIAEVVARFGGEPVRVVLRLGTEIDARSVAALRELPGATVVAESPFLARWLANG